MFKCAPHPELRRISPEKKDPSLSFGTGPGTLNFERASSLRSCGLTLDQQCFIVIALISE